MAVDNVITIVGNLADDPELRYTPSGVPVTNVRVAVNQRFYNRETQQWDERLDGFFTANVWRDHAENVADSLHKGARVLVTGRLRNRSYENKEGQTRWVTEIEADEVCPSLRWAVAKPEKVDRRRGERPAAGPATGSEGPAPPEEDQSGEVPTPQDVPF